MRQARRDELISLQQDIGQEFAQSLVGQEVPPSLLSPLCSIVAWFVLSDPVVRSLLHACILRHRHKYWQMLVV